MSRQCAEVIEETRRAMLDELRRLRASGPGPLSVLDVGCWDGATTVRYRDVLGGAARGVEVFKEQANRARSAGVEVAEVDLETETIPFADGCSDVVVANQVFEHLKNVWVPMSEMARLVAPGGHLVFSVPNLASLHNRVMLAFGFQPSAIRTFGPHIRGFTYRQTRQFVEYGGFFKIRRVTGVGFYPLPARLAGPLARAWVAASHTPILIAQRVAAADTPPPWTAMTTGFEVGEQTFYRAPQAQAPPAAAAATSKKH
jgi:SAM-dependent methyltransferase